ncbi:MRG/MORF4L-binding protein-like [Scleropages formosus]|uniref:MRG/MORF4L binding protein n=1 Tax=Scleropages formosus TaxID=113540 RepID=A0A8C9R9K2_SCLFO|nr:MRG/MORF4L-binding protein-like [Scleropages formosus]
MGEAEALAADDKAADSGPSPGDEPLVWSQEVEVCLFHAMLGHKPVGVNRHFHMICIRDKFSQNIGRQVSSKVIWDHLSTMYDMQALDESEILPFPNSEKSFVLPEEIIQEVKEGKLDLDQESKEDIKEERDSQSTYGEGSNAPAKVTERSGSKHKERDGDRSSTEGPVEKKKRSRAVDKGHISNGNPPSPGGTKRRRT